MAACGSDMTITNDIRCVSPDKPVHQLRIIYQGGSIAALASASLLASAGHQVVIFEKDVDMLELNTDRASGRRGRVSACAFKVGLSCASSAVLADLKSCMSRCLDGTLTDQYVGQACRNSGSFTRCCVVG